jgi:hypothetical protein
MTVRNESEQFPALPGRITILLESYQAPEKAATMLAVMSEPAKRCEPTGHSGPLLGLVV